LKRKYAILILAAGESKRLGHPKQLVQFKNKTLLQHTIDLSQLFNNSDTYLILGAHYQQIISSIKDVKVILNKYWSSGMGSSISVGINEIISKGYQGALILLCDQPFLSKEHITNIFESYESSEFKIVSSRYNTQIGAPCFFSNQYFDALSKLNGEKGAKSIIQNNIDDCFLVDFDLGYIDIDTPQDLNNLTKTDE